MKSFEPQDPMELVGVRLIGDVERMAECLVEEYMLLGWTESQLMTLFERPFFASTHRIYHEKGAAYVRALIRRIGQSWHAVAAAREAPDA